jgi:hypothetical protein
MSDADATAEPTTDAPPAPPAPAGSRFGRWLRSPWTWAVTAILAVALIVRLWGIRYGLPFAYNLDERSHFVPRAVKFFSSGSINPDYQLNPSGLIELIAAALGVVHGGSKSGVVNTWNTNPGDVWAVARIAGAIMATAAVGLLYAAGARFWNRWVGLLAAALLAVCFLPVHYGHLALNDAPSLAPTALCLFAVAGILRQGRWWDYLLAGVAVGVAVGFKYNAAFLLLPIVTVAAIVAVRGSDAAAGEHPTDWWPRLKPAVLGLLIAGGGAIVGFLLCDPYALLDPTRFKDDIQHLSDYTKGGLLLGETQTNGWKYYVWSIGWGFGYLPAALTLLGGVMLIVRDRLRALILLPAPILFFLYVGSQGRYFARYVMPIFPVMCLVAAAGAIWLVTWVVGRFNLSGRWKAGLAIGLGVLACAQGVVYVIHNDLVLSREDTRTAARDWMVQHIPAGEQVVVEPIVPKEWYIDGGRPPQVGSQAGYRWSRAVRSAADRRMLGKQFKGAKRNADFANYEYTLFPGLIDYYRQKGVCWYVSGSMQSGRAFNNPGRVPQAIKFYAELERQSTLAFAASPYGAPGDGPKHPFQYDQSFDYYPLSYEKPGPQMRIYRLNDCTPKPPTG